jgi:hypothetical protein
MTRSVKKKDRCDLADSVCYSLQSLVVADKTTFRNCLVTMRPRTRTSELASTHEVTTHIHNEFVEYMKNLKEEFEVSNPFYERSVLTCHLVQYRCNIHHCRWMDDRHHKGRDPRDDSALDPRRR